MILQLTLEPHGLNWADPLIHRFFSIVNTAVQHDPRLAGSLDAEPWRQRNWVYRVTGYMEGRLEIILRFSAVQRVGTSNPALFKGQL